MTNIYYPVYKNLESEFLQLAFSIHIDDNQLGVYSSKITDLVIRAVTEIESISKELYKTSGGAEKGKIHFDRVAIKHLNGLWNLDKKVVIISSPNIFLANKILKPFEKNELKTGSKKPEQTFDWNNAYQNLKHDRANSLKYGSIKYLLSAMAALYILNVYFKNDVFNLGKDSAGATFPVNLGSEIFSIKLHYNPNHSLKDFYTKSSDFAECIYLFKATDPTAQILRKGMEDIDKETDKLLFEYISMNVLSKKEKLGELYLVGADFQNELREQARKNHGTFYRKASAKYNIASKFKQLRYEAVLNIGQF